MALTDYFDAADVLASLSWVSMSQKARVAKLASLYLDKEDFIRRKHRNYEGPNTSTVGLFMRSLYKPPRGMGGVTIASILEAIPAHREKRKERKSGPHSRWYWPNPTNDYERRTRISERRNAVAAARYGIIVRNYNSEVTDRDRVHCISITRLGGCVAIFDRGGRKMRPRVYLRNPAGKEKVVVLDIPIDKASTVTNILLRIAPQKALRGMFDGKPVCLNFDAEGFDVGRETVPWRNVLKVYSGREAVRATEGEPKIDCELRV